MNIKHIESNGLDYNQPSLVGMVEMFMNSVVDMVVMWLWFIMFSSSSGDSGTLYKRTLDISTETFKQFTNQTLKARSSLSCARQCHYYNSEEGNCNAYSFKGDECTLAKVEYLEDPDVDAEEKEIYIDMSAKKLMVTKCRGGERCCTADNLCSEGEGDCENDQGCGGISICGQNNCPIKTGGRWDSEDDCCTRRCTPEHPCLEAEGHCESDNDCKNTGWAKCGDNLCLNQQYFPTAKYPNNTATLGFSSSDNCCYRVCNEAYNVCPSGSVGCLHDSDCVAGVFCDTSLPQPSCVDIEECDIDNTRMNGTAYCGDHATCANTVGSFTCSCSSGYVEHTPWTGCREKDECTEGGHDCKENTDCTNKPGSWECSCSPGFTGEPTTGCTDIDECADQDLNTCSGGLFPHGYDADIFGLDKGKTFYFGKGEDGFSHSFTFSVRGNKAAKFYFCQGTELCYLVGFGLNSNRYTNIYKGSDKKAQYNNGGSMKLSTTKYKAFVVSFDYNAATTELELGVRSAYKEEVIISWTDKDNLYAVDHVKVVGQGSTPESIYVRNLRKSEPAEMCVNNVGNFTCLSTDEEGLAVGFGGHTTSGSVYPTEIGVVTNDGRSCLNHGIPDLAGRYSPGVQVLDNWLFVCGGSYYGASTPLVDCKKLDMNERSPSWTNFVNLPQRRRDFPLVRYDDYMYAVAGYNYGGGSTCLNDVYRIKADGSSWEARASLPYSIHRHCGVADQGHDRIYIVGGHDCSVSRAEVYYYTISANTWTHHSTLPWGAAHDCACGVITQKDGTRMIVVNKGSTNGAIILWNIDSNTGWHHQVNLYGNYYQRYMFIVTLTPYSALMLGGYSQRNSYNIKNFWMFNQETKNFEAGYYELQNEYYAGQWAVAKKTHRALENCVSERVYAAVGWGGHTTSGSEYPSEWSVLLRKRQITGDPHKPVRCDNAIPDLSPGRYWPGVTAVGYRLIMCGGHISGGSIENYGKDCYYLGTRSKTKNVI